MSKNSYLFIYSRN